MFWKRQKADPTPLDELIDETVQSIGPYDDDFVAKIDALEKLNKLRGGNTLKQVSPDTVAIVAGNVVIAVLIVGYESRHVVTSKALGLLKLR
jgi:hypothetical protein